MNLLALSLKNDGDVHAVAKPKIAIIAVNALPYIQLAKLSAYSVVAVDAFADLDTRRCADVYLDTIDLSVLIQGSYRREVLDNLIKEFKKQDVSYVCYGSGLESCPDNLDYLAQQCVLSGMRLLGNLAYTVKRVKNPEQLQHACGRLGLHFPEIYRPIPTYHNARAIDDTLPLLNGWLVKREGGCGGEHISTWQADYQVSTGEYCQAFQAGIAVAALFISDGHQIQLMSVHEQWQNPGTFDFSGAIQSEDANLINTLFDAASKLAHYFNLLGINSLDAIWDNEQLTILEINPRLSASVSLCASKYLFDTHINTCLGKPLKPSSNAKLYDITIKIKSGFAIIYSTKQLNFPNNIDYPAWVANIPNVNWVEADMPICTIHAQASSTNEVKTILIHRIHLLKKLLGIDIGKHIKSSLGKHT